MDRCCRGCARSCWWACVVRKGTVEGHASQSYVVAGRKGQKLAVDLRSTSSSLYFNLRLAGSPEALYASDRGETGNTSEVTLPVDGDYQIDVYLYRSAARRGAKAPFTITAILNH